jgi:hypothetical protein
VGALHRHVLRLDRFRDVRRQLGFESSLVVVLRRVFPAFTFVQYRFLVFAGDGGLDVYPAAMKRGERAARVFRIAAEALDERLQFAGSTPSAAAVKPFWPSLQVSMSPLSVEIIASLSSCPDEEKFSEFTAELLSYSLIMITASVNLMILSFD